MKRSCKQIGAVSELPEEIIFEILVRVSSATSLWEFRRVCKSWCSLISSTRFIQTHLKNSLLTSNFALISTYLPTPTTKIRPLYPFLPDYDDLVELECPVFTNYDGPPQIHVVSTCNGLCLMVVNQMDLYLWNPFIKKVRKLADFVDDRDLQEYDDIPLAVHCSAFVFDERTRDYNVVAFIDIMGKKNITKLYSLKSDSWRRFADFECTMAHRSGKFHNGMVHWLIGKKFDYVIESLDLTSEEETTIWVPRYVNFYNYRFMGRRPVLGVHDECLSVLCGFRTHWRLWLFEESSWVMVGYFNGPEAATKFLCVDLEGEILLLKERAIFVYDPKFCSFRHPRYSDSFLHAAICIQSLVSPYPGGW